MVVDSTLGRKENKRGNLPLCCDIIGNPYTGWTWKNGQVTHYDCVMSDAPITVPNLPNGGEAR